MRTKDFPRPGRGAKSLDMKKSICVYCGSNPGAAPDLYAQAAQAVGVKLAQNDIAPGLWRWSGWADGPYGGCLH
jgi:predicted Rossmann-fold nucleotide-binding protein